MPNKILFIGDFDNKYHVRCLEYIAKKYGKDSKIFASGTKTEKLTETVREHSCIDSGNYESEKYHYFNITAGTVFVMSERLTHSMENLTNQIVYTFQREDFEGKDTADKNRINYSENEDPSDFFPDVEINDREDIIVFTDSCVKILKDKDGFKYFLKKMKGEKRNVCVVFTDKSYNEGTLPYYTFHFNLNMKAKMVKGIINNFDGAAIFMSELIQKQVTDYYDKLGWSFTPKALLTAEMCNILSLSDDVDNDIARICDAKNNYVANREYRRMLDKYYSEHSCHEQKVSIIICRYNTPLSLLFRAIDSALDCLHLNTEVIVVDDGSNDNIEESLRQRYPNLAEGKIRYLYKENEGPGLSRNYGIRHCTGEYVFYLDSDDTVEQKGIPRMLAHMNAFGLEYVAGKRVLCESDGSIINESLRRLCKNVFQIYYYSEFSTEYDDQMTTNKLYRKRFLEEKGIWFQRGLYEDLPYSAELYSKTEEHHCINVRVYNWYQYGENKTISSSININNFREKARQLEKSWTYVDEPSRYIRMRFMLCRDFIMYLRSFQNYEESEQQQVWEGMRLFLKDKKQYVDVRLYQQKFRPYVEALLEGDYERFKQSVNENHQNVELEDMGQSFDNYFASTNYHLLVAIIRTIDSGRPSRLYLYTDYQKFSQVFIARIEALGVFESVITFKTASIGALIDALETCPDDAGTIIPTYLYGFHKEIFRQCDPERDTAYIFSDLLPYWYYVERTFRHIVKLEDAYNSFDREMKGSKIHGKWGKIVDYVGKEYPLIHCRSSKIDKVIVSSAIKKLSLEFNERIFVEDTIDLVRKNEEKLLGLITELYDFEYSDIKPFIAKYIKPTFARRCARYCKRKIKKMLEIYKLKVKS